MTRKKNEGISNDMI